MLAVCFYSTPHSKLSSQPLRCTYHGDGFFSAVTVKGLKCTGAGKNLLSAAKAIFPG